MEQINYIIKRILQMIPVLFIITILIFLMIRLIPGDPARLVLGEKATNDAVEAMRIKMGLNRTLYAQYMIFMKGVFSLDLGKSIVYQRSVIDLLKDRIGVTFMLTCVSTIFSLILSFPLGYFAGVNKDKFSDNLIRGATLAAISMPSFWVGLLLMLFFGVRLGLFPVGGWAETFPMQIRALILPGITQCLVTSALLIRNIRNSVVDISNLDYVDFARSKGIREKNVRNRHVLRNTLISTCTLLAMRIVALLGGSVIVETVFSLPGIGSLMVNSIFNRDYPTVQSLVLLIAIMVLVINLLVDILYSFLDPRVRL